MRVVLVVGTRPNFIKAWPLLQALNRRSGVPTLLHTGQHADPQMSECFFQDLGIPAPDISLGIGSGSDTEQIARTTLALEPVLRRHRPELVVVFGDVNATLAAALVAASLRLPLAHVEAGLRSFDRSMQEEINRVVVDALSRSLFTSCLDAGDNLRNEGVPQERIFFVGNIMIDTLLAFLPAARAMAAWRALRLDPGRYAVLTLHRPSNVDAAESLRRILEVVERVQRQIPVVFPVHPRTRRSLEATKLWERLTGLPAVRVCAPMRYVEFLSVMERARLVLTDSGGIQEETTVLGVPCLTLRENTERPVTVRMGTNRVVGTDPKKIEEAVGHVLDGGAKHGQIPELWDGKTAERIADMMVRDGPPRAP